jgi:disulfide bond formation protein DsbB
MRKWFSYRSVYLYLFIICSALLVTAAYLQYHQGLEPCPLCILQRLAILILGLLFMVNSLYIPSTRGQKIFGSIQFIVALMGASVAARHVYLQHLPANLVPACGPKLSLILKHLPLTEAVKTIFEGTGECAAVNWSFLGFSMPQWTLAFFMVFAIVIIWQALRKTK